MKKSYIRGGAPIIFSSRPEPQRPKKLIMNCRNICIYKLLIKYIMDHEFIMIMKCISFIKKVNHRN